MIIRTKFNLPEEKFTLGKWNGAIPTTKWEKIF